MRRPTLNPIYSTLIMFAGMLIGLVVLLTKTAKPMEPIRQSIREFMPSTAVPERKSIQDLLIAWKTGQRLQVLMQKHRLSKQDSLEIKSIDQQLNQLLHD